MSDKTTALVEVYDKPPDGGTDYILQVKIKNGPMLRAIRMRGYKTIRDFQRDSGMHFTSIYKYLSLKSAPIDKHGQWKPSALKMAAHLRLPPDSLFPEQHLERVLSVSSGEIEISPQELLMMAAPDRQETPEDAMIRQEKHDAIVKALQQLTPRKERVLRLRFGFDGGREHTLQEIADKFGLSRDRVRMIEANALGDLRHPTRSRALRKAWSEELALSSLCRDRSQTHCGPIYTDEEITELKRKDEENAKRQRKEIMERLRNAEYNERLHNSKRKRTYSSTYSSYGLVDRAEERSELSLRLESTSPWWEHRPRAGNAVRCTMGYVVNEADENNPVFKARSDLVVIARRDGLVLLDWREPTV